MGTLRHALLAPPLLAAATIALGCTPSPADPATQASEIQTSDLQPSESQASGKKSAHQSSTECSDQGTPHCIAHSAFTTETPAPKLATPSRVFSAEQNAPESHTAIIFNRPAWTRDGALLLNNSHILRRLAHIEKHGPPTFDPSSNAWFASANGSIVRIQNNALLVVADGIQGNDIDVRTEAGLAVSREPNDTIVLHKFGKQQRNTTNQTANPNTTPQNTILFSGPSFFHPRFSPNGKTILVSESQPEGGHIWITKPNNTSRIIAQGSSPTWHPNGQTIVFIRLTHDGHTLLSSEVWAVNVNTAEEKMVGPSSIPIANPSISPDGTKIAFADSRNGDIYWASFNNPFDNNPTDNNPTDNNPTDNNPTDNNPTDNNPADNNPLSREGK